VSKTHEISHSPSPPNTCNNEIEMRVGNATILIRKKARTKVESEVSRVNAVPKTMEEGLVIITTPITKRRRFFVMMVKHRKDRH